MWTKGPPIAVLASDLHIDKTVPVARAEKDWFEVQANYFQQVQSIIKKYNVPFIVAGDVFNKPHPDPETVNFAHEVLPDFTLAVPGQHDLLYHSHDDIRKTGYWSLVLAGKIHNLKPGEMERFSPFTGESDCDWYAIGCPWNFTPKTPKKAEYNRYLAVIHAYIWNDDNSYPNAPKEQYKTRWAVKLKNYDAAIFGDNHKPFIIGNGTHLSIMNGGCFIARRSDEKNNEPRVGLLYADGTILPKFLDTSKDKWCTQKEIEDKSEDLHPEDFLTELASLASDSLDFRFTVEEFLREKHSKKEIRRIIHKAMEKKK